MPSRGEINIIFDEADQRICWTKKFSFKLKAVYAHQSVVEVFNSSSHPYAEIELHDPFQVLGPQESARMEQTWQISACSSKLQRVE
jgi:hypothetical protein